MLFFTPDRVLKILKPVDTGFVDFVDRDTRLEAASREFELNYRISPDVYLDLVDLEDDGRPTDRIIVMRRLPAERQLNRLAEQPGFERWVSETARFVATFHAGLQPVTGEAASVATADRVRANWRDNFDTIGNSLPAASSAAIDEAEDLVDQYLTGRDTLFEQRIDEGRIVDGHGDLRAEHVFCLDDGPRVIDCLAFRDDYRIGDVLSDIAFLAMDLHRLVGPQAARDLVRSYDEFSNEHHPSTLAHHYVAYRAHVRAKVAAVRLQQGDRGAAAEVQAYHALALEHLRAGQVRLVLVGGGAGVGKSTVAEGVAHAMGAVWLRSDEVRKSRAGLGSERHHFEEPGQGLYDDEVTEEVYRQMLEQAEALLVRGESVVLDATWSSTAHRAAARRLADRTASKLTELQCVAPLAVAKERIARRMASLDEPSDATPQIAQYLADRFERWPEADRIDTAGSIADSVSAGCASVLQRPDEQLERWGDGRSPGTPSTPGTQATLRYEAIRFFLTRRPGLGTKGPPAQSR